MKAIRLGANSQPGLFCRHCNHAIRRGQVALVSEMPNNPITDRKFAVHVTCMRSLVESAPKDQDEEAFLALRERIAVTGRAFPD